MVQMQTAPSKPGTTTAPATTSSAPAEAGPLEEMVRALAGPDEAARLGASRKLVESGKAAVPALLRLMDGGEPTAAKRAGQTLFRLAQQAAGGKDEAAVAAALAGELRGQHTVATRREICRLLSFVGDDESLLVLYPLLGNPDLAEMAKFAITRIPGQAATMSIVAALQISEHPFRVGLIHALGERGDLQAVPALVGGIESPDPATREAVLSVLAALPSPPSLTAIRQAVDANVPGAVDALLALGLNAGERGQPELAREVFEAVAGTLQLTAQQDCRLMQLLPYTDPQAATPDAVSELVVMAAGRGSRNLACLMEVLSRLPSENATRAVAGLLQEDRRKALVQSAPGLGEARLVADLLGVLAERWATMTDEGVAVIREASRHPDEAIRRAAAAAIEQLARRGVKVGSPAQK